MMRDRSASEVVFPHIRPLTPLSGSLPNRLSKFSVSLNDSKQNLLVLPKVINSGRRSSIYSDDDTSENSFFTGNMDSGDEDEGDTETERIPSGIIDFNTLKFPKLIQKRNKLLLPTVSIIPPEEDGLFLAQTEVLSFY